MAAGFRRVLKKSGWALRRRYPGLKPADIWVLFVALKPHAPSEGRTTEIAEKRREHREGQRIES
jgi:hypothetical protein